MAATYPRTMLKGAFKGETFESPAEYQRAVVKRRQTFGPTRTIAYRKGKPTSTNNGFSTTRRIVDAYDLLREQGLGKAAAVRIIDDLVVGGV